MHLRAVMLSAVMGLSVFVTFLVTSAVGQDVSLEHVLTQMDSAAKDFRSLQASFSWDQYTKVVNDTDTSKGSIYFQRDSKEIKMAAEIMEPSPKSVVFMDGEAKIYEPKIDRVTAYKAGKNRAAFESFLVLGFGGRGHDLPKSYDIKYLGKETIDGVETEKLELTPKSEKVRNQFSQILLWIDPKQGISLQQKLLQSSGDYRLAKYTKIVMNQKLPDGVFKLKTTPKTTYLAPQG